MPRKPVGPRARRAKPLSDTYAIPAAKLRGDRNGVIEQHIVTAVIETAQKFNAHDPNAKGLLANRVQKYLRETGDPPQVEFVLTEIVKERAEGFLVIRDFSPGVFEWMRLRLGHPPGAWKFAWWAENCENRQRRRSAECWLGWWADRLEAIDPITQDEDPMIARYKAMLQKLYDADMLEYAEW